MTIAPEINTDRPFGDDADFGQCWGGAIAV